MTRSTTVAGLYLFVMGFAITGLWAMLLTTGQTPELAVAPLRFALHLVAEFVTALACIVGGYGFWRRRVWGRPFYLVAAGLLLYAVTQAAGYYYLEQGAWAITLLFLCFALATFGLLGWVLKPSGVERLLVFLGMVLYASVQTSGYFAQAGEAVAATMFCGLIVLTCVSLFRLAQTQMPGLPIGR